MRRVLITGAGGFIGSHMVDACIERGDFVIAIDQTIPRYCIQSISKAHAWYTCDICDLLEAMPYPFDVCFHLAAEARIPPSYKRPMAYVQSNVMGTAAVLEAARNNNAKVVYAGSSTAADSTLIVYAATKFCGEKLCETWHNAFDVHVDIARFYNVYGPREHRDGQAATILGIFTRQFYAGEKLTVTGDGSQTRSFTHVADIVDGLLKIADKGDGDASVYDLGSKEFNSILSLAKYFVLEEKDRIEYIPRPPGEMQDTRCVNRSKVNELGWEPRRSVGNWIDEIIGARASV